MLARLLTGQLLVCLLLCGCSRSRLGNEEEVSGKVTYNGKPLTGGWITFMSAQGHTFSGPIDPEGNYKVRVLVGETRITVDNRMLQSKWMSKTDIRRQVGIKRRASTSTEEAKSSGPDIPGTYMPLPNKYFSPDTSGLTYTVESGSQTHNIELSN